MNAGERIIFRATDAEAASPAALSFEEWSARRWRDLEAQRIHLHQQIDAVYTRLAADLRRELEVARAELLLTDPAFGQAGPRQ